jgi:hypothetical protein
MKQESTSLIAALLAVLFAVSQTTAAFGQSRVMNPEACWSSHPQEWQPLLQHWKNDHPDLVTLHEWRQFGGGFVRAVTITRPTPTEKKFRLIVTVPHAHEPGPTAATVDFACQLLTGKHRDGTPATDVTAAERELVLSRALLTLIPDTNPQGRARAPERCWDGKHDNDFFLKVAFGIAADGQRFGRYPEWKPSEHKPRQIGIEYEQVEDDLYVEPNTSRRSAHTKAMDELFARHRYTHHLDMHQHEGDEAAFLPAIYDDLPADQRAQIDAWSAALINAWRAAGANPRPQASVPYRGQARQQFFKEYWAGRCPGMLRLTSEVHNNRHAQTGEAKPLANQFKMSMVALTATVKMGLGYGDADLRLKGAP